MSTTPSHSGQDARRGDNTTAPHVCAPVPADVASRRMSGSLKPPLLWPRVVVGFFSFSLAGSVHADPSVDAVTCQQIADDTARLHCFDALFPLPAPARSPVAAAPPATLPNEPSPAAMVSAPVAPNPVPDAAAPGAAVVGDFGAEQIKNRKDITASGEELKATLIGQYDALVKGDHYHLDNGQIWENINDHGATVSLQDSPVIIKRNMLGSYFMSPENRTFSVRVRRLK